MERVFVFGVALVAFTGLGATDAAAQQEGFLFGTPKGSLALKVGYHIPRAESDLFVFTQDELTVDEGDFNGFGLAGNWASESASGWTSRPLSASRESNPLRVPGLGQTSRTCPSSRKPVFRRYR